MKNHLATWSDQAVHPNHRVYGEFLLTSIKLAMGDVISFAKYSNPKNIAGTLCSGKKYNVGSSSLVKHWHPGEYSGAYDFVFSNSPIFRDGPYGPVDCSLKGLIKHLPHESDVLEIRDFFTDYIIKHLGYFPVEGCGFKVFVDTKFKEMNMKKLETTVFDYLVQLTRNGKLEWNASDDPEEQGAAPELITDRGMTLDGTYLANYDEGEGNLTCTISRYLKPTAKKKNYSEYIICIQLIKGENVGYNSHLVSKGMGRLWNLINKKLPESGNLSIAELSNFLSELCD